MRHLQHYVSFTTTYAYKHLIYRPKHYILSKILNWDAPSHGIAFITVGVVGFIMSLTTADIGQSLKDAIREEGAETRAVIIDLSERMDARLAAMDERMDARLAAMDERMEERDRRMEERDRRMEERLERMSTTVETISKDNRAFFKQILYTQKPHYRKDVLAQGRLFFLFLDFRLHCGKWRQWRLLRANPLRAQAGGGGRARPRLHQKPAAGRDPRRHGPGGREVRRQVPGQQPAAAAHHAARVCRRNADPRAGDLALGQGR